MLMQYSILDKEKKWALAYISWKSDQNTRKVSTKIDDQLDIFGNVRTHSKCEYKENKLIKDLR